MLETLYKLIIAHAVTDFALQSEHHARMKYRNKREGKHVWFFALAAHSILQGGGVYLVTGSMGLGIAETIAHFCIDFGKCEQFYGSAVDQALHLGCKGIWMILA